MIYFLTVVTRENWQNDLLVLDKLISEKRRDSTEIFKILIFEMGVGIEKLYSNEKIQGAEIISVSKGLNCISYLKLFDSFFEARFSTMFNQRIYLLLNRNNIVTSALLLKAVEYLSEELTPVYYLEESFQEIDIPEIAPKKDLKFLLVYFINQHDYKGALEILNQDYFWDNAGKSKVSERLKAGINSMIYRMNWDFTRSRDYWLKTSPLWEGTYELLENTTEIHSRLLEKGKISEQEKIREILRQILIKLSIGDMGAFLTRLYRFREMIARYIWNYGQDDAPALNDRLPAYEQIDALRDAMAEGRIKGFRTAYFFIRNGYLTDTLRIRSSSFIGHGRAGFSNNQWIPAYMGTYISSPEAVNNFLHEVDFLLEDLGLTRDDNYNDICRYFTKIIKYHL